MIETYPPELQEFMKQELEEGRYHSETELLVDALKVFRELKTRHATLQQDVLSAIREADCGETHTLDMEKVIDRARKRFQETGVSE